jgi:hypothetical protein
MHSTAGKPTCLGISHCRRKTSPAFPGLRPTAPRSVRVAISISILQASRLAHACRGSPHLIRCSPSQLDSIEAAAIFTAFPTRGL